MEDGLCTYWMDGWTDGHDVDIYARSVCLQLSVCFQNPTHLFLICLFQSRFHIIFVA